MPVARALPVRDEAQASRLVCRAADISVLKYLWLSHRQQPRSAGDALLLLDARRPAADTRAQAGSAHVEPPCNT
ncbi:hypothetical protein [Paraburkholderia sp. RL17-381-BIF-C]|uniref:hypothetical protein n=1 Tax=Paraburkholderia sp. RL17-381-BIF-C TaxID=3031635 RepID=UPI0038B9BEDB